MATVRNKNTKPEIQIRKSLFRKGYRYKINDRTLPGSPDIVMPKYNTVIFVHGCFWHGHRNCKKSIKPNSNIKFWKSKISINKQRDKQSKSKLKKQGWKIIIVWECEIRNTKLLESKINYIEKALQTNLLNLNLLPSSNN